MFIQGNTVAEKSFIARCLVFLVDFSIFQKLDFGLHRCDLLLEIVDVIELELVAFGAFGLFTFAALVSVVVTFKVRHAFEFLVAGECVVLFVKIATCVLDCITVAFAAVTGDG